jgi:Flp pilus assembly protein TadG
MNIRRGVTRQFLRLAQRLLRAKCAKGEEGTALVELAISLPIMLTLLTGAASFSLAFYSLQELGNATTTAVQLVAANQGLVSDPCETATAAVESALPNWKTTKLSLSMTWTDSSGTQHSEPTTAGTFDSAASFSCASAGDGSTDTSTAMGPNTPVVLTVSYSYAWLPILKFTPSSALTSTEAALAD